MDPAGCRQGSIYIALHMLLVGVLPYKAGQLAHSIYTLGRRWEALPGAARAAQSGGSCIQTDYSKETCRGPCLKGVNTVLVLWLRILGEIQQ